MINNGGESIVEPVMVIHLNISNYKPVRAMVEKGGESNVEPVFVITWSNMVCLGWLQTYYFLINWEKRYFCVEIVVVIRF